MRAVVRRGSFNCSNSPPPTSPILQIVARPLSLLGTQRLMHHYTAINTFFHRPCSDFHCYVIIILFPPLSWAYSVLLMSIIFRKKQEESESLAVSNGCGQTVVILSHVIITKVKSKWIMLLMDNTAIPEQ